MKKRYLEKYMYFEEKSYLKILGVDIRWWKDKKIWYIFLFFFF